MFPRPSSRRTRKRPTSTLSFVKFASEPLALAVRIAEKAKADPKSIFASLLPEHRFNVAGLICRTRRGYFQDYELAALLELRRSEFPHEFRCPDAL